MRRIPLTTLPTHEPAVGLRTQTAQHAGRQLRLVEFAPGFHESEWCGRSHIGYILTGRLEIEFADGVEVYSTGDVLMVEAGDMHRARVVEGPVRVFLLEEG